MKASTELLTAMHYADERATGAGGERPAPALGGWRARLDGGGRDISPTLLRKIARMSASRSKSFWRFDSDAQPTDSTPIPMPRPLGLRWNLHFIEVRRRTLTDPAPNAAVATR